MYDLWYKAMSSQYIENAASNPNLVSPLTDKATQLVGVTRPRSIRAWARLANRALTREEQRIKADAEKELTKGEVRFSGRLVGLVMGLCTWAAVPMVPSNSDTCSCVSLAP